MKTINLNTFVLSLIVGLLISIDSANAQAPQKFSYQAVVRDGNDELATNQNIGMQISILEDSATGSAVYVERHFPTTNVNGLVSLEIGTGAVISGNFEDIEWSNHAYFVQTETDLDGGLSYSISGTSQLMSVPYALFAKQSGGEINYSRFTGFNSSSVSVDNEWTPLGISPTSQLSITKLHDNSTLEIHFNSTVTGGVFSNTNSVLYDITINDEFPNFGNRGAVRSSNTSQYLSFMSVFENLPAGNYILRVVARATGSSTNASASGVLVDPGGLGGGIIIKEIKI